MDIKYFAGLFDGEGCVYVQRRQHPRLKNPTYLMAIQVAMTHEGVIRELQRSFGGRYYPIHWHTRRNNRTAYLWRLNSTEAAALLTKATEFMIVKKAEALVAIEFQAQMDSVRNKLRHMSPEEQAAIYAYREQCNLLLRALKRVSGAVDGMDANSEDTQNGQPRAKLRSV